MNEIKVQLRAINELIHYSIGWTGIVCIVGLGMLLASIVG